MNKRWGYWTFWVGVSAIASFVWGLQIADKDFWPSVGGMLAGIGCFIVFYTLFDDFARKNQWHQFIAALQKGIYIKAGLQIINLVVLVVPGVYIFISPECWAGSGALYITDLLGVPSNNYSFLFNFVMTLVTGALLSFLVAIISVIVLLMSKPKKKKDIFVSDAS